MLARFEDGWAVQCEANKEPQGSNYNPTSHRTIPTFPEGCSIRDRVMANLGSCIVLLLGGGVALRVSFLEVRHGTFHAVTHKRWNNEAHHCVGTQQDPVMLGFQALAEFFQSYIALSYLEMEILNIVHP